LLASGLVQELDAVAVEEPLEIRVAGRTVAVLLRTPGHEEDLAVGFCLTEGLLHSAQDVDEVRACDAAPAAARGNVVDVLLRAGASADFSRHLTPRFSNSACGVCGTAALENLLHHRPSMTDVRSVVLSELMDAPRRLLERQPAFRATGGLHAAGILHDDGNLHCVREDVGRHNASDKAIGAFALEHSAGGALVLVVSSRAGFEIVEKAHAARIPVVVSVGAPTSLAVDMAQGAGLTLCAFAGADSIGVYTHPSRIRG